MTSRHADPPLLDRTRVQRRERARRRTLQQRLLAIAGVALVSALVITIAVVGRSTGGAPSSAPQDWRPPTAAGRPIVGIISGVNAPSATAERSAAERAAGVSARTFEVAWMLFEPQPGQFDERYIASKRAELDAYRAQGFLVAFDMGIHYPPDWVRSLDDGAVFRNQFDEDYETTTLGKKTVNVVFDQKVRDAVAAYTARLFSTFGTRFDAIRVGGGGNGELHYPDGGYNGHVAPLWAYDPIAQGASPGLATGLAPNPVPGWRPGDLDPGNAKAAQFYHWYIAALANWQNWQIASVRRSGFDKSIYVLYGAYGMREGTVSEVDDAIRAGLQKCRACDRQTLSSGQDWAALVAALPPDRDVFAYTTWVDGPDDVDDSSGDPATWSPVRYLSWIASRTHRRIGGENAGDADRARLQRTFRNAQDYDLVALYWYAEPQLFDGRYAGLSELQAGIATLQR